MHMLKSLRSYSFAAAGCSSRRCCRGGGLGGGERARSVFSRSMTAFTSASAAAWPLPTVRNRSGTA